MPGAPVTTTARARSTLFESAASTLIWSSDNDDAESTGIALGTVKTHIRRGLGELQRRLFAAKSHDGVEHD